MKKILVACLLCFTTSVLAQTTCPSVNSIKRTDGAYSWETSDPLWEGFFISPTFGRGHSTQITQFNQARWLQLSDLKNAKGVMECDYTGNHAGEIIRFVQVNHQASSKPTSQYWSCNSNTDFPAEQCTCGGEVSQCAVSG